MLDYVLRHDVAVTDGRHGLSWYDASKRGGWNRLTVEGGALSPEGH